MVYDKENLTAKVRGQNCVMCVSAGGASYFKQWNIPSSSCYSWEAHQVSTCYPTGYHFEKEEKQIKIVSLYHSTKGTAAVEGNRILT